jgi:hypothetical protein
MNVQELTNLSQKTREDGKRLFGVCELIYNISMVVIWAIGIVGGIASLGMMSFSVPMGIGMALVVAAICFFNYMIAVLSTHVAKVMVHTSFATLGLLEHFSSTTSAQVPVVTEKTGNNVESKNLNPVNSMVAEKSPVPPLDGNDPSYIEGTKLVQALASHGYGFVRYDIKAKKWVLRGGSNEFDCNLDQLRDLHKNFN